MDQRVNEYLVISDSDGKKVIRCRKCQYEFCPATENYKNHALVKECALAKSGTLFHESKRFIFREFYCPGYGAQLEVEAVPPGHPLVFSALPDIDGFYNQRRETIKSSR